MDEKKIFGFVALAELELEVIKKNDLRCCGKENCFEKAAARVSTRFYTQKTQDRPAMIMNCMCTPILQYAKILHVKMKHEEKLSFM